MSDPLSPVIEAEIEAALYSMQDYCTECDPDHYGLPVYTKRTRSDLADILRKLIKSAHAELSITGNCPRCGEVV